MITSSERAIVVDVPVTDAYAIVSDPAMFPAFLHGVADVRERDDGTVEFVAEAAGGRTGWTGVLTEEIADVSVAWTSRDEVVYSGVITLEAVSADRTRVTLRIDHDISTGIAGDPTADLDGLAAVARARGHRPGARRVTSLVAATQARVTDTLGEPIGDVRDAFVDLDTHMVTAIAVGVGGSDASHLVPIPAMPVESVAWGLSIPYPPDMVREAPAVEPGLEPGDGQMEAARRHFGDAARWIAAREAVRDRQTAPAPTPELQALADADGSRPGVPAPTPEIAAIERRGSEHTEP